MFKLLLKIMKFFVLTLILIGAIAVVAVGSPPFNEANNELSRAFEDSDPKFQSNESGATGRSLRIGISDGTLCRNGNYSFFQVPEGHPVYDHVGSINYLVDPVDGTNYQVHHHAVMSAMMPYLNDSGSYTHRGVFEADFFVAHPVLGNFALFPDGCEDVPVGPGHIGPRKVLEWFLDKDVTIINQSVSTNLQNSAWVDWYARYYDLVYFMAAGNQKSGENRQVNCSGRNYLCVGGFYDQIWENNNTAEDLLDDIHDPAARYGNPGSGSDFWDRELPHLVARSTDVAVAGWWNPPETIYQNGTSVGTPIAAAIAGLQLQHFRGDWRDCRVSEWTRANLILNAGRHPVDGRTTAYHEGHELFEVDQRSGWGAVTPDPAVLEGRWSCLPPGDGEICMPSMDGSCPGLVTPDDDKPLPFEVEPPPNKRVIQHDVDAATTYGTVVEEVTLTGTSGLRGVMAWSSCPFGDTDSISNGTHVDFDLAAIEVGNEEAGVIWLSYSYDSTVEAFEFFPKSPGTYQILRIPKLRNWDVTCTYDQQGSVQPPYEMDGEYISYQSFQIDP